MLDVLLMDRSDGAPIVGEVKVGGDQNLFYALVQGLMHVAALAGSAQRARLVKAYAAAATGLAERGPLDLYLLGVSAPPRGTRPALALLAEEIAQGVFESGRPAGVLRRVVAREVGSATARLGCRLESRRVTASWSEGLIESECAAPYADYVRTVEHHYHEYFHAHPELGTGHPLLACDLDATLPHGWSQRNAPSSRRSGIAGILIGEVKPDAGDRALGAATDLDPSLAWLTPVVGAIGAAPRVRFEYVVEAELLGEHPRQTAIDVLAQTSEIVLAIEVKWTEQGLGTCRCGANARAVSACARVVRGRSAYWSAALTCLDAGYTPGAPCQVGLGYQAVRLFAGSSRARRTGSALGGPADLRRAQSLLRRRRRVARLGRSAGPGHQG